MSPARITRGATRAFLLAAILTLVCGPGELLAASGGGGPGGAVSFSELWEVVSLRNYNTRLVVLSTSLLGISSGMIGTFLLLRKRSLMGDALSHATLPGIGIAFILMVSLGGSGKFLPGLLAGAAITGTLGVLLMLAIRKTTRLKDDVAMGFVLSVFFGSGVAILGIVQSMPQASAAGLESFIYGKAASMVWQDFLLIAGITAVVALAAILLLKEFTLLCFDEGFAATQGWPILGLDLIMLALVTTITVIGLQAVGLILIIAFLIIPATAARFWSDRLRTVLALAALIGGISGWLGASLSALLARLPAGALIVIVAAVVFLLSMFFAPARGVLPRLVRHAHLRRKVGRQHLLRAAYEILESQERTSSGAVMNAPFRSADLAGHRAWKPRLLRQLLRTARREDHIEPEGGGMLRLSESGFGEAARITRNHRLWELYLIRHADIAPNHVDRDADMVEHVLGGELVRQLERELLASKAAAEIPASPHPIETPGAAPASN
ncbi:MAG: iron chelate uptake ABC transporter family permease subunit [Verrucomicrobiales bacterium]